MDTRTGHLVRDVDQLSELARETYEPVPPTLRRAAQRALGKSDETYIDVRKSRGKLAAWARQVEKRKARRKGEKAGRKAARKGR